MPLTVRAFCCGVGYLLVLLCPREAVAPYLVPNDNDSWSKLGCCCGRSVLWCWERQQHPQHTRSTHHHAIPPLIQIVHTSHRGKERKLPPMQTQNHNHQQNRSPETQPQKSPTCVDMAMMGRPLPSSSSITLPQNLSICSCVMSMISCVLPSVSYMHAY